MKAENEKRVERAVQLFKKGFNCAQSVTAAFADIYGYTEEQALKMSAGFGGGIGRMRQTCGAFCGATILAGLDCGVTDGADRQGKSDNYKVVQDMADKFKTENGSLICADLLGLNGPIPKEMSSPEAAERTPEYYKTRPCAQKVECTARIYAEYLESKNQ